MESIVLNRVGILGFFCPKEGQGFRPSAAPLHPNMRQVPLASGHPQDMMNISSFLNECEKMHYFRSCLVREQ